MYVCMYVSIYQCLILVMVMVLVLVLVTIMVGVGAGAGDEACEVHTLAS